MRRLRPVIENNLVVRWECDACHWRFCLRTPRALSAYSHYTLDVVQNAFSAHDCFSDTVCRERKASVPNVKIVAV